MKKAAIKKLEKAQGTRLEKVRFPNEQQVQGFWLWHHLPSQEGKKARSPVDFPFPC